MLTVAGSEQRADAGPRAAVRWARNHATLYDESYHACMQLTGAEADLLRIFGEAKNAMQCSMLRAHLTEACAWLCPDLPSRDETSAPC